MHGAADALAYGVKVTGCTLFFVDDGVDTGPIVAQAAVAGRGRRHLRVAARADQGRRARAAGRHGRRDGAPGLHHRGQEGPPWTLTTTHRIPIKRALVSVYDKSGLEELVRGLHDAGVALVSTGGSAALIEGLGVPVTKVEELTGFPECLDGRVKTLHPKVHAGILADRRLDSHVQQLEELGRRALRPRGLEPLPVPPDRPLRRDAGRVRRADRHRRPVDGPGRGQEPPLGRDRHQPGAVRRRARRGRRRAASRWRQRQRLAAEAFQHTATLRRRGGELDGQRAHRHRPRRHRVPGLDRRDLGQGGGAALRREPAPAGRALPALARRPRLRRAAARQGDVLQQLRRHRRGPAGGVRLHRAGGGDHQARQPVRHRGRRATWPRRTAGRTSATRPRRSAA